VKLRDMKGMLCHLFLVAGTIALAMLASSGSLDGSSNSKQHTRKAGLCLKHLGVRQAQDERRIRDKSERDTREF
jgi:hypothetical protein